MPCPRCQIGSGGNDFPTFDVTCSTLVNIDLVWAGVWNYRFSASALTILDGNNIIVGSTTGTQIATATTQKLGFWGATPVVQPAAYTPTNVSTDRSYDANATSIHELADVLGTLIADLQSTGFIG